jgi:hypothetical protein
LAVLLGVIVAVASRPASSPGPTQASPDPVLPDETRSVSQMPVAVLRTPEQLEAYYAIPTYEPDATQVWLAALRTRHIGKLSTKSHFGEGNYPLPGTPWSGQTSALRTLARENPLLTALHEAAGHPGRVRFPTEFHRGCMMLMPEVQEVRTATVLLELEAITRAYEGDFHASYRSLQTMYALAATLDRYPAMVAFLAQSSCNTSSDRCLLALLPRAQFTPEQLVQLQRALQRRNTVANLREAFQGELVIGLVDFTQPEAYLTQLESSIDKHSDGLTRQYILQRDVTRDREYFTHIMERYIAASQPPFSQSYEQWLACNEAVAAKQRQFLPQRMEVWMSLMTLPGIQATLTSGAWSEASRQMALAALGVERYRRDHGGQFPATLAELVPTYLDEVPIDPFDGQPIRYRPGGTNVLLYSVGVDRTDNGGNTSPVREPDFAYTVQY